MSRSFRYVGIARNGQGDELMATKKTSDDNFEADVLKSSEPVVVDFWAEWCGPCKMIAPALEEIASEMSGQVKITKINIDENPLTPQKYGVKGLPTLMMFKNGAVAAQKIGAASKSQLAEWVAANI